MSARVALQCSIVAVVSAVAWVAPATAAADLLAPEPIVPIVQPPAQLPGVVPQQRAAVAEKALKDRQAWLRSPKAVTERRGSRSAHDHLSAAQAVTVARQEFPPIGHPLWAPPKLQPGDRITGYAGDNAMRVDRAGAGGQALVDSSLPLWTESATGERERVSVALRDRGDQLVPENPFAKTSIAKDPQRGVEFSERGFVVRPVATAEGLAPQLVGGKAFFANAYADTDWIVAPLPHGVETFWQLRSPASPESFTIAIDAPKGARIEPATDGSRALGLMLDETQLARIAPPAAVDAQGQAVDVSYDVNGLNIVVRVAHRNRDLAYPVLVDPEVQDADLVPHPLGWFYNTNTGHPYWGGYGWGQYGWGQYITNAGTAANNAWGAWQYIPPGQSFITHYGFGNINWSINGAGVCWVAGTSTYDGGAWQDGANSNSDYGPMGECGTTYSNGGGWFDSPGDDLPNRAIMELWNQYAQAGGGILHVGYQEVWLSDNNNPSQPAVESVSPQASSGWMDIQELSASASSNDAGLGVNSIVVKAKSVGSVGDYTGPDHIVPRGCAGTAASPCQGPFATSVTYPLPEGDHDILFYAGDAAGWGSPSRSAGQYKVDRSAPSLTLGGLLWDRRGRTLNEDATLTVLAQDGVADGGNKSHRSGMQSLSIDWKAGSDPTGTGTGYTAVTTGIGSPTGAASDGSSAKQEGVWTFDGSQKTPGPYTFRIRATDNMGHVKLEVFEVTVGPGSITSLKEGQATARRVTLQAKARSGFNPTGVTFKFRRDPAASWQDVPTGMVRQGRDDPVSGWPLAMTGDTTPKLSWDLASTSGVDFADGDVQIQAVFSGGSSPGASQDVKVMLDRSGVDGDQAVADAGPGKVDLLTGNFSTSQADVSVDSWASDLTVARTYNSRRSESDPSGPLGPGWVLSLPAVGGGSNYVDLFSYAEASAADEGLEPLTYVAVGTSDGGVITFTEGAIAGDHLSTTWTPENGYGELKLRSIIDPAKSATRIDRFELTQTNGDVVTFVPDEVAGVGGYKLKSVQQAASQTPKTTFAFDDSGRVTRIIAPVAAGLDCTSGFPTGCRGLDLTYATANATSWPGDFAERLISVSLNTGSSSVELAHYSYHSDGRLAQAWDPRLPALKTSYAYSSTGTAPNAATVLTGITPPGEEPWTIGYLSPASSGDTGTGRVDWVKRTALDPNTGAPSGNATTDIVYGVPLSGSGAPYDMSASGTAAWDQNDMPTDATAVFPANQPVASPPLLADISYLNTEGRLVNSAEPGGHVDTTERDRFGNVVRDLTARNRAEALATGANTAAHAARSRELDTQRTYSADGADLLEEFGPAHAVAGITPEARRHTTIAYDEGKPAVPVSTVYHLPTTRTVAARALGASTDVDARTTKTEYDWTLRKPTKTIVDPTGLAMTSEVKYDNATGLALEEVLPRDTPSASTPKTAGTTQTTYYSVGSPTNNANCVNSLWANLPCKVKAAADPTPGAAPKLPITTYEYNEFAEVTKETETVDSVMRVSTIDYANGRKIAENVTCPAGCTTAEATPVGQLTFGYSATTGRLLTTTNSLDGRVITRAFDSLGRLTSYTDADGTQTTNKYDILDRTTSTNDGQATTTFEYDDRGLQTRITDTDLGPVGSPGTVSGTYDPDGNLVSQALPGGLNVLTTFDAAGAPARRCYIKAASCSGSAWIDFTATENVHGQQMTTQASGMSGQTYAYDKTGRLITTQDTVGGQCTVRGYGYDVDSNRLSVNTKQPAAGGACSTAAGTTVSHTYDTADRVIDSGYVYDTFGRVTHVPGRDAGGVLDAGYYVNDLAQSIKQGGRTTTIDLDPGRRPRVRTTAPAGGAETAHYADDTDEPSWTSKGGVTQRDIEGLDGDLVAVKTSGSTAVLQLTNIHGDVVAEAPATAAQAAPSLKFETDEFGIPRPGRGPIFQVGSEKTALSTAGTSIGVPVPEGVQQDDLLLGMFALGSSATVTATGWTATTANITSGTTRYRLYYRVATASEPSSYTFTASASAEHIAAITALRNTAASAPAVAAATGTSDDITAPSITPAAADSAINIFGGQGLGDTNGGSAWDFPSTFVKSWDASAGTTQSATAALRVLSDGAGTATGTTPVTSQTGAGSGAWGAITAAITPANTTPTQTRYGYVGGKARRTSTGAGTIEMGVRLYVPQLGRFLQADPVRGGSANAYDYANQDPVNQLDVDGEMPTDNECLGAGICHNSWRGSPPPPNKCKLYCNVVKVAITFVPVGGPVVRAVKVVRAAPKVVRVVKKGCAVVAIACAVANPGQHPGGLPVVKRPPVNPGRTTEQTLKSKRRPPKRR